MNDSISFGRATSNAITGHTSPVAAIADIQSGKWGEQIAALRKAIGDEADRLKRTLPAILWTGKFTSRKNGGIENFSGYLCADIDKVPKRIGELHDTARSDRHAAAAFVSPSGTGIKIVFRVPVAADAKQHQQNFNAVRAHVAKIYNAAVDEAAKDVARLCFVSHDPAAFFNAEAVPLDVTTASVQPLDGAEIGARNNNAFKLACECRDKGQTPAEARAVVRDFAAKCTPPLPEVEADGCVKSAFSKPALIVELPELVDAADFLAETIEPPAELVAGILHRGSKLAFGGSSKSFKTWCLLDLAISVATGADWLGRSTAQGKVLFLNFEIQPHAWQRRIAVVAKAKGVELKPGQIILWNLRGYAADFRQIVPRIIDRARRENFALTVCDPIYKFYGSTDENAAGDVAALLNSLERLAVETGSAVAYGCHFAKGNAATKDAIDRISGSGVFARDPDSLLIFTKHEQPDSFAVEPILRNFAPVAPFVVSWKYPLMERDEQLDPADLKQTAGRKREHDPLKLLAAIANNDAANPVSVSEWARLAEIPRKTLESYLAEMRRKNWIKTVGEGSRAKQAITNEGKAILNQ
jgi:predicted transcriptional regulator